MGIKEIDQNKQYNQNATSQVSTRMDLKRLTDQIQKTESIKQQTLTNLLDKNTTDRGTSIVSNMVASFAKSTIGKLFQENTKLKVFDKEISERDYLRDGEEQASDVVDLSTQSKISRSQTERNIRRGDKEHALRMEQELDSESKTLIKEYSQLYGKVIATKSGAVSAELEKLENKLKQKGYTSDQLFQLKLSIKTSMRNAVMQQVKDAFLKRTVSLDMVVEWGTSERGLSDLLGFIEGNQELGGTEFGGYKTNLQGAVNQSSEDVCREVRIALKEILDQKMTERLVSNTVEPKKARAELQDILRIGERVGFSVTEYMKTWYKEKVDQGLFVFQRPDMPVNINTQLNEKNEGDDSDSEAPAEETEEFLVNRLRALFIRAAIKSDWRTSLDTQFKIIKTKNKMIKLGIFSQDVNDKVKKESQLIAAAKIMEMLKESFLERGTLYKLSGPAYKLIDLKITGLMKNAEKLGIDIGEYEFNLIRDNANQAVFEVAKRELQLTVLSLQVKETPVMRDKKKKLIQLMERIKEESNLTDDIGLPENEMTDRVKIAT